MRGTEDKLVTHLLLAVVVVVVPGLVGVVDVVVLVVGVEMSEMLLLFECLLKNMCTEKLNSTKSAKTAVIIHVS